MDVRLERAGRVDKRANWILAGAVIAAAISVVVWREMRPAPKEANEQSLPQVVMFVDLSEVNEVDGCGAIIRSVRQAASRGVRTLEVDARSPGNQAARFRLLTAPVVVFLNDRGIELARLEGESAQTIRQIQARLDAIAPAR